MDLKGYVPIEKGLRAIGRSQPVQDLVMRAAGAGRSFATAADPSGEGDFTVTANDLPIGWKDENRVGAILSNTADNAWYIEREYHVLARAVDVIENYR